MSIKSFIKKLPLAVRIYEKSIGWVHSRGNGRILAELEKDPNPRGEQIAGALRALSQGIPPLDPPWIDRIESERTRHLDRREPLVDGSLGEGGLYDAGVTIQAACSVSKPAKPAQLLFSLTRALRPERVIELGTNVGLSSAYIGAAMALDRSEGQIVTLDASPYRQRLAAETHRNIGIDNIAYVQGLFTETLIPALTELGPIDLAFIDGHHQYQPTLDYFEAILAASSPNAVFVFDDIRWSDGMKKAWREIQSDTRLGLIVDVSSVGVCVRSGPGDARRFVSEPFIAF